jgi:predicted phosphodiesterase
MRIAVLSDIHANVWALEAVLADARARGADAFLNLGDVLYGPLAPRATFDLLRQVPFVTIQGNQDREVYDATPAGLAANPTLSFVTEDLGPAPIAWLRALPRSQEYEGILLCHGTPDSDVVYLLEDVSTGVPRVKDPEEIAHRLRARPQRLVLCGHSHIPRVVTLPTGQTVVNPGSVGLPAYDDDLPAYHRMETHSPLASYAILETGPSGFVVEHRRVDYPYSDAEKRARSLGREDWALWLRTGFAAAPQGRTTSG